MNRIKVDMLAIEKAAQKSEKDRALLLRSAEILNSNPLHLQGEIVDAFNEAYAVECDYYDTNREIATMMGTRASAREAAIKILAVKNGENIDDGTPPSCLAKSYMDGELAPIAHKKIDPKGRGSFLGHAQQRLECEIDPRRNASRRRLCDVLAAQGVEADVSQALMTLIGTCPRALVLEPIKSWRNASLRSGGTPGTTKMSL